MLTPSLLAAPVLTEYSYPTLFSIYASLYEVERLYMLSFVLQTGLMVDFGPVTQNACVEGIFIVLCYGS